MNTSAVAPGTRLADRYRLEDRVSDFDGSILWKAIDEILARPVSVRTFDDEFPRTAEVVTAARAASRLTDSRLTQVFDAFSGEDLAYVVSEWAGGDSLGDLLSNGPLEPQRAAGLIAEVAEGLASAHQAGLSHLCLAPESVHISPGGTVKLLDVGIEAALTGITSDQPALEDAVGLGRLLYAALTAHWPGPDGGLPEAPVTDEGQTCSPRQVRAGVPAAIDSITCRALLQEPGRGMPPLTSPAEVADALAALPRPVPASYAPSAASASMASQPPHAPAPRRRHGSAKRFGRSLTVFITVLVLGGIGVGAWLIGRTLGGGTGAPPPPQKGAAIEKLDIAGAESYDPEGDKEEHPELVRKATDGEKSTQWRTDSYNTADFGRLKKGVGLLLDMGKKVSVSQVVADLGGISGASVELRLGNSKSLSELRPVAKGGGSGEVELTPQSPIESRYVVLWFTKLGSDGSGHRGVVRNIEVNGSSGA